MKRVKEMEIKGYCPTCDSEVFVEIKEENKEYKIKDLIITCKHNICICKNCGDICYNEEIEDKNDFFAYEVYKKKKGLVTGAEIIDFRSKYNLTQIELAQMLGFGEKSITRYELGQIQDECHDKILRAIMDENGLAVFINQNKEKISDDIICKINDKMKKEKMFYSTKIFVFRNKLGGVIYA